MPLSLSSLNPWAKKAAPVEAEKPKEVELAATPSAPVAPAAPVVEATAKEATQSFEWNVGRLYSSEPGKSSFRTWAVRILSTLLVFPLVLTLLVDLGRRLAFSRSEEHTSELQSPVTTSRMPSSA